MAKSKGKHHKADKSDASGEAEVEQPPPDKEDEGQAEEGAAAEPEAEQEAPESQDVDQEKEKVSVETNQDEGVAAQEEPKILPPSEAEPAEGEGQEVKGGDALEANLEQTVSEGKLKAKKSATEKMDEGGVEKKMKGKPSVTISEAHLEEAKSKGKKGKKKGKEKKGKKGASEVQGGEKEEEAVLKVERSESKDVKVARSKSSDQKMEDEKLEGSESKGKMDRSASRDQRLDRSQSKDLKMGKSASVVEAAEEELPPKKKKKKKGKGKKTKKSASTSQADLAQEEGAGDQPKKSQKGKKKRKGKKAKKSASTSQSSLTRVSRRKKGKEKKLKTVSMSEPSLEELTRNKSRSKTKMSQQNLSGLISKMSASYTALKATQSRSKSAVGLARKESEWTYVDSDASEDSDYSYEDLVEERLAKSSVMLKPKTKKKGKKGKGKKGKSTASETETGEEGEPKKKKKKKGKGKKKKRVEETSEEEEGMIEPQDDILAEIARMKYLAELEASGEETEGETTETEGTSKKKKKKKKKKKGPKKKLSKKEKARLAAEQAEKARMSAEEEAAKAAELERIRLEEERKAAIEKEKRESFEQQIRTEQLEAELDHFNQLVGYNKTLRAEAKAQEEWEFYVNCGRLPNPSKCDQMNTFLHLWENVVQETTMEEAARRTVDMLELLNDLDDLIDTADKKNDETVENWKWVRLLFRQQQAKSLDVATYRLLRDIEKNLHRIDIPTADYKYQDENVALCLWLRIQLPTPLPNPRRPPKPRIEVNFKEMKLEVQFPPTVDGEKTAVRALYVKYDHLSDLSDTYQKPDVPEQYDIDLWEAMRTEWRQKLLYKYDNRVRKTPVPPPPQEEGQEGENPPEPPPEDVIGPEDEVPVVPYRKLEPTASEYVITREDDLYKTTRTQLDKTVPDDVINLRKYSVIGGVYALHLVHQPPQPQDFVTLEMTLTPLYLPKQLELVDLYLEYSPPAPAPPGVRRLPEEIEEEMKKHEEELEKLILVTLTWPEHVIFLELPMVCYWDDERRVWSKSEVHDLKHNEEKGQLSFRTRKGGVFALATYRYANLPYQAWELRPEANGTISLQITAAILMVEFNVKDGLIALSQLQNSPNNALQDIVGTYYPLPKLVRTMQSCGVDVFPAFDAFCYIESTCEKHWPMEKHLYFNMAELGVCFNFAWSRWNLAAGRRNIVLQMREYNFEKTKQKSHLMLHVTPLNAIFVDCTEVSQTFNEEGIENMKFYPDLFHLMKGTSSMAVKKKIGKAPQELVFALYELLIATRVVSFS